MAIVQDAAELITIEVRKLLRLAEQREEPVLQARELSRLVKEVVMLERLITGSSTDNVAVSGDFKLSRLSIDEIETLRALEAKAACIR